MLVRQYVADRSVERLADFTIGSLDPVGPPERPSDQRDERGAERHGVDHRQAHDPPPHGHARAAGPAQPAGHGGGRRPGRREHHTGQPLHAGHLPAGRGGVPGREFIPPGTRYWSVTVENIWHECIDPRRRTSSATNATAAVGDDGKVRLVIGDRDPGDRDGARRHLARHRRPPPGLPDPPLARPSRTTGGDHHGPHRPRRRWRRGERPSLHRDDLVAAATEATGLDDFGEPTWQEGLDRMLEDLDRSARPQRAGGDHRPDRVHRRTWPTGSGSSTGGPPIPPWPEGRSRRPLVICGQPRTGTTILFDLLAQDPAHRAPLTWEVDFPVPPPTTATYDTDPRIEESEGMSGMVDLIIPGFTRLPSPRGPPGPGVRPHHRQRLPLHDVPDPVRRPRVRGVAAARGRSRPRSTGGTGSTSSTCSPSTPPTGG